MALGGIGWRRSGGVLKRVGRFDLDRAGLEGIGLCSEGLDGFGVGVVEAG